ncbi:MAG: metallophosphoesterase family protein [Thermoleophilia bacterium]|nr:metallophosphoesterase family protein [Thermoleophilia bacterium]
MARRRGGQAAGVAAAFVAVAARLPTLARVVCGRRPALTRFEEYARGIAVTAADFNSEAEPEVEGPTVLVVSDLHANLFGAALAARVARGDLVPVDLVLVAGDVTDGGTREEALLVARLLATDGGPPVLAVGGNHDGAAAMDALGSAGFVLPERTCVDPAGLRVYGASDPLARSPAVESDPSLLAVQAGELAASWPPPGDPEILLVHDVRQAREVVTLAETRGTPLVVACGNDHRAAVERRGPVTIVNAGTAGASGYGALGRGEAVAYTAQLLHFGAGPHRRLRRVTSLSYCPGGRSTAVVEPIDD